MPLLNLFLMIMPMLMLWYEFAFDIMLVTVVMNEWPKLMNQLSI
jgi:hypothetical protein